MSSQSYVIELDEEAVGLVVREDGHLTFHAVHPLAFQLHGLTFSDPIEARRAAAAAMGSAA